MQKLQVSERMFADGRWPADFGFMILSIFRNQQKKEQNEKEGKASLKSH